MIIWQFYAVIFDPDVYPVSWTWFDGKMTESQYRHEHGEAWEQIQREQGKAATTKSTPTAEKKES